MKKCSECQIEKPIEEFPWKNKPNGQKHYKCKLCFRVQQKEQYQKNKPYYYRKARKNDYKRKLAIVKFLIEYFDTHPCVKCGEIDPLVLSFDHDRSKDDKEFEVNNAEKNGKNLTAILEEIDKCQVLCMNCHSRKTAAENGFLMYKILNNVS